MDSPVNFCTSSSLELHKNTLWKQLHSTERICQMAHNVRQALNKVVIHKPLLMVVAPRQSSNIHQEYHQKVELEQACLDEAGRCFTQAWNTPLLSSPLIEVFGKCSHPKEMTRVLVGTFTLPTNCDWYAAKLLSAVSWPQNVVDVLPQTTLSYRQGWQKAQEKQVCLPWESILGIILPAPLIQRYWWSMQQWQTSHSELASPMSSGRKGWILWLRRQPEILTLKNSTLSCYSKQFSIRQNKNIYGWQTIWQSQVQIGDPSMLK